MNKNRLASLIGILAVMFTGLLSIRAQINEKTLEEKRITIQMTNKPVYDVFMRLMYVYDVPIGFEESALDRGHDDYFFQTLMPPKEKRRDFPTEPQARSSGSSRPKGGHLISLNVSDVELREVLDQIVNQMKNYTWKIDDDVVNIFPVKGRVPVFERLLNLNIREFRLSKGQAFSAIQPTIIFNLAEFKGFVLENDILAESDRYIPAYGELRLPEELQFSNLSFKRLLNGITRAKRGGWILRSDKHDKAESKGRDTIELLL